LGWAIRQSVAFGLSPQVIHRIEFGCGARQKAQGNAQVSCYVSTVGGGMGRPPVFEQDDVPTGPMPVDHLKENLMDFLRPNIRDEHQALATPDVERTMQDAFGVIAGDGHTHLSTDTTITTVERRRFGNDGFVEHQRYRVRAVK